MIGLKLVDPIAKIEEDIRVALINNLNLHFNKNKIKIADRLKENIKSWVLATPEIASLRRRGIPYSLHSLFGLKYGTETDIVENIASSVANSMRIDFIKIDKNFKGGLIFKIQPVDFQNLIGLPEGHVYTGDGADLHWLSWLLERGDEVIVSGYQYDPTGGRGRSGGGIMVKGSVFRVPPSYSGVLTNNFVTKALQNKEVEIARIMSEVLK